jgi:hypothetical protein
MIVFVCHFNTDLDDGGREEILETLVFNSTLIWLLAQEDFSTFICCDSFKCYKNFKLCLKSYKLPLFNIGPTPTHYFYNHNYSCQGLQKQAYTGLQKQAYTFFSPLYAFIKRRLGLKL